MPSDFKAYPIIFTHVPRSAGTTLVSIMSRYFNYKEQFFFYVKEKSGNTDEAIDEYNKLPENKRTKLKLLQGHTSFGIHNGYPVYTYVTLLRNPVERIVSYYYYILKKSDHYLHNIVLSNKMRLDDFIVSGISAELDNIQTRQISGVKIKSTEICNRQMLETAMVNLTTHYPVFGITERFDEMLILMKRYFGWTYPFYKKLNTIPDKPLITQLPVNTLQLIEKTNAYDLELYQFACLKFQAMIEQQDHAFRNDLKKFRKYNAWLENIRTPYTKNLGISIWDLYTRLLH